MLSLAPFPSKRVHFSVSNLRILQFPQSGRYAVVVIRWQGWDNSRRQSPLVNPRHGALLFSAPAAARAQPRNLCQAAPLTGSCSQMCSDVLMQLYHWPAHYHGRLRKQSLPPFCLALPRNPTASGIGQLSSPSLWSLRYSGYPWPSAECLQHNTRGCFLVTMNAWAPAQMRTIGNNGSGAQEFAFHQGLQ